MLEHQFWHLCSPDTTAGLAEWVDGEVHTDKVICPVEDGHQRGGKRLTNLSVMLPGRATKDFVWTWYSECLLTDRTLGVFASQGFSGFEVKPVKAAFKRAQRKPPRLWELVVTGWAGMAPAESGIRLIEDCPACGLKRYSAWTNPERLVDAAEWDGSDFFMVWPLPGYIFVAGRVAQAIHEYALAGCALKPLADVVFPSGVIPSVGPGRLSYYMPEKRARELGEPLGIY